jgi:hypothetical protein
LNTLKAFEIAARQESFTRAVEELCVTLRCYLVRERVAGFGEQLVNAIDPTAPLSRISLN